MEETICKECQTQNPAANAFCTACGHKLQPILVRDIGESLQEGYKLVAEERFDQALLIGHAVLQKSPHESGAYALMAMVHEEKGDIPQAIRCYEEVVRLRPESKIDAIKLAQLRDMADPGDASVAPKRGLVVALSVGAAVLAVAVGLAFAWPRGDETAKQGDNTLLADNGARGFEVPETVVPTQPANQVPEAQEPNTQQQPNTQPAGQQPSQQPVNRANRTVLPPAGASGTRRNPNPSNSGQPLVVDITPDQLSRIASNNSKPPTTEASKPPVQRPADDNVIERRPGQINISESRKANPTDPNIGENTYRIAQDKMKAGDYRAAIRDFQSALAGSDKKAMIHQLIGRCYTRLGEKASAKQHFEVALGMYEAAGSKSAADSVRREIGLLG